MSVVSEEKLVAKLGGNKAYREAYVIEHVKTSVPLQIRHLREQRDLTQTQLAEQAKTTQTVISRLEDPNYGNLTLNSLLKIASAFDIGLLVKFVPFSRLLLEFQDLSPKALSVKSFTDELVMLKELAASVNNATLVSNFYEEIAGGEKIDQVVIVPPVTLRATTPEPIISGGISTALQDKISGKDILQSEKQKQGRLKQLLSTDNRSGVVLDMAERMGKKSSHERGEMPYAAFGNFSR